MQGLMHRACNSPMVGKDGVKGKLKLMSPMMPALQNTTCLLQRESRRMFFCVVMATAIPSTTSSPDPHAHHLQCHVLLPAAHVLVEHLMGGMGACMGRGRWVRDHGTAQAPDPGSLMHGVGCAPPIAPCGVCCTLSYMDASKKYFSKAFPTKPDMVAI